jgi:hypothetical protein
MKVQKLNKRFIHFNFKKSQTINLYIILQNILVSVYKIRKVYNILIHSFSAI